MLTILDKQQQKNNPGAEKNEVTIFLITNVRCNQEGKGQQATDTPEGTGEALELRWGAGRNGPDLTKPLCLLTPA